MPNFNKYSYDQTAMVVINSHAPRQTDDQGLPWQHVGRDNRTALM